MYQDHSVASFEECLLQAGDSAIELREKVKRAKAEKNWQDANVYMSELYTMVRVWGLSVKLFNIN